MAIEVEETPEDDPYNDGFVTPCIVCFDGLVLVLPNYWVPERQEKGYSSCDNPECSIHTFNGPQV